MAKHSPSKADLVREVELLRKRLSRYEALDDRLRRIPARDRARQDWFRRLYAPCPLPNQTLDLAGRVQTEMAALRESEMRLRELVDLLPQTVFEVDDEGCFTLVNRCALETFGYRQEEIARLHVWEVFAPEDRDRIRANVRTRLAGRLFDDHEYLAQRRDGSTFPALIYSSSMTREGRIVAFVRDITEQKQCETRIKEREAALLHAGRLSILGEMASGIAHELNQPLAAILSYGDASLHLTRAKRLDIPRIARNLEEIVLQGERAGVVVRRMRALAKSRRSRFSSIDLNDAVRNAVTLIRWELAQNGMQLRLETAESLPSVHADAILIEQVLLNLMRNAIDAMRRDDGGPRLLTVRTMAWDNAHVRVEVCDSGVGLPPSGEDRIFEPFFTTKPDGLGVGLSISRSIVETHKGSLAARANPDRGATFFFTLPARQVVGR